MPAGKNQLVVLRKVMKVLLRGLEYVFEMVGLVATLMKLLLRRKATLDPAYNEFGYKENSTTVSRFLCINFHASKSLSPC